MGTRRRAIACFVGATLLAACGNGSEGAATPGPEGSDERPCSEVVESLEEPNRIRAETFGGGPEGRQAMATIIGTVQQRPDCFSDEEVEFASELAETLPSDAEVEAIEAAEAACDGPGGEYSQSGPGDVAYDNPEEALVDDVGRLPDGVAERSHEGQGRVDFEFHDEAGDYQGWVMVRQADTGWFVRWMITCGADTADP